MSVLEAGMVVCFGASWPVAVLRTLKTKSAYGAADALLARPEAS
ncbi:MAG TPA: hypothetical protein VF841_07450 [Anaeromyxobacter sp.]